MSDLDNLFDSFEEKESQTAFVQDVGVEKIVFIHDSYQRKHGNIYEFSDQEYKILKTLLEKTLLPAGSYQFVAAIKDFNVKEDDLTTKDIAHHRELLEEDLKVIQPSLVIPLGRISLTVLNMSLLTVIWLVLMSLWTLLWLQTLWHSIWKRKG